MATSITRRGLEILHTVDPDGHPTQGGRAALARLERDGLLRRVPHRPIPYQITQAGRSALSATPRPTPAEPYDPAQDAHTPEVAAVLAHGRQIRETESHLRRLKSELDVLLDRAVPGDAPYPHGRMKLLADRLGISYDWVTKSRNRGRLKRPGAAS